MCVIIIINKDNYPLIRVTSNDTWILGALESGKLDSRCKSLWRPQFRMRDQMTPYNRKWSYENGHTVNT